MPGVRSARAALGRAPTIGSVASLVLLGWSLTGHAAPPGPGPINAGPTFTFDEPIFGKAPTFGGWREAVTWNGTDFLVVWWDLRGISAARVSEQGTVRDDRPIRISTDWQPTGSFAYASALTASSDGASYLIAWTPGFPSGAPRGVRIGPAGDMLDLVPRTLAQDAGESFVEDVALVWNGSNYLLVWSQSRASGGAREGVLAARLSSSGSSLDAVPKLIGAAPDARHPSVACAGTNCLLGWVDRKFDGVEHDSVVVRRVTTEGDPIDPSPVVVVDGTLVAENYISSGPYVTWNGNNYVVAWSASPTVNAGEFSGDVYATRIAADGSIASPFAIAASADDEQVGTATSLGSNSLLVWSNETTTTTSGTIVRAASVDPSFELPYAGRVAQAGAAAHLVVSARCGFGYCSTLYDDIIEGVRVDAAGVRLDSAPFVISLDQNDQTGAVVGFTGSEYLVAWEDTRGFVASGRDIYAGRVTRDGTVVDGSPFPLVVDPGDDTWPHLVMHSGGGLLIWSYSTADGRNELRGMRLATSGEPLERPFTIVEDSVIASVAWNGSEYLVGWSDAGHVVTVRISPLGQLLDPAPVAIDALPSIWGIAAVGDSWIVAGDVTAWLAPDRSVTPIVLDPALEPTTRTLASSGSSALLSWGQCLDTCLPPKTMQVFPGDTSGVPRALPLEHQHPLSPLIWSGKSYLGATYTELVRVTESGAVLNVAPCDGCDGDLAADREGGALIAGAPAIAGGFEPMQVSMRIVRGLNDEPLGLGQGEVCLRDSDCLSGVCAAERCGALDDAGLPDAQANDGGTTNGAGEGAGRDSGCGCSIVTSANEPAWVGAVLVLFGGAFRRRRTLARVNARTDRESFPTYCHS